MDAVSRITAHSKAKRIYGISKLKKPGKKRYRIKMADRMYAIIPWMLLLS
jgi:hypothetical protein